MPLNDLNRELYNQDSQSLAQHTHEQSQYDPFVAAGQTSPFDENKEWDRAQKGLTPKQKKKLWIGLSILSIIVLAVGGTIFYRWWAKNAFHQDRVSIYFEGPKEADSTQQMQYIIHYKNDNRVTLKNPEIDLSYSENFQPIDNLNLKSLSPSTGKIFIPDIAPSSEGQVELKGIFYAPKDSPVYLRATLLFTPSNGSEQLSMEGQLGVNITTSPVLLEVTAPKQAVDGDKVEYVIDYKNLDTRRLSAIQIHVDFPSGFKIIGAQPAASQDTNWLLGNLEAGQGGQIRVQGQMHGGTGESKNISVSLGHVGSNGQLAVYNKNDSATSMVSPSLAVVQKLDSNTDGVVQAGDVLKYTISYKNTSSTGLRDAIITEQINGKVLDFSKINIEKGAFDGASNTITWKASDVPSLANINPGAGGEVHFQIPVKSIIPVNNSSDKNFIVSSIAKIDSPDIPTPIDSNKIIGSNQLDLKLASKVLFDVKGYYNDQQIKNTGPIPIQVGKETTFTMHFSITNISNDIANATITSSLPSGVRWTGSIYPSDAKVNYNSRTNQITWNVGNVSAGAGVLSPVKEMDFQVGVTPQTNQVGGPVSLVNQSNFTATDTFTGKDLSLQAGAKNTQLYEDSSVGYGGGKVSQ
ncbi:MAG TPA: hypothetical protein VF817_02125 [Patescibacteria group bacterium]